MVWSVNHETTSFCGPSTPQGQDGEPAQPMTAYANIERPGANSEAF